VTVAAPVAEQPRTIAVADKASGAVLGRTGRWADRALVVYAALGFVYLFLPIAVIVLFSFNRPRGKFNLVWQGFTLDNWANPFAREALTDAFVQSLLVAAIAVPIATVLGSLIAIALSRYRFRGGALINLFLVLPLTTPEIVMGSSLAALFINRGVDRGLTTIVISHVLFCVSFVAVTVKARIRGFDWTLEDAAMDLGATPWRTFRTVTLPLIVPGIVAAALLSVALSVDDFIITLFNAGDRVTFPLQIFGASRVELSPQINVLATMLLLGTVAVLLAATLWQRRRDA
jgi:spermidine/putrescine transport system permease protein